MAAAQTPGEHWEMYKTPEEAGWSSSGLADAKSMFDATGAAAFVVVYDGRILAAWGDVTRRYMCHSVRKSLLSGLYGARVADGTIDIDKTLAGLGIDDISPLTDVEKRATVRDLLKSRSGVYHPAAYETQSMKNRRPKRGSHEHNTFWYYNNWDFNTLGAIFEQKTGADIFEEFDRVFARPLEMEEYRVMDGYHHLEAENSQYPAYPFKMSARDLARFGLLYMRDGEWNGTPIIPRSWVEESTTPYSAARNGGYAYLWWTDTAEGKPEWFYALGYGGQVIGVNHDEKIVAVQRVDTYVGKSVSYAKATDVIKAVMAAKTSTPKPDPQVVTFDPPPPAVPVRRLRTQTLDRYAGSYDLRETTARVERDGVYLVLESPTFGNYRMMPLSEKIFFVEDMESYAVFDADDGEPSRLTLHDTKAVAEFYCEIETIGREKAIDRYREAVAAGEPVFSEREINNLGYVYLSTERVHEAIAIFELNVEAHPSSFNVYDSLGEAHTALGDREAAIRNYEKSLELDPNNANAKERLQNLKAQ
jgi:CubicO group peptidase (beta-lactamase class C family)